MKASISFQLPDDLQPKQIFLIHAICYLTNNGWTFANYNDENVGKCKKNGYSSKKSIINSNGLVIDELKDNWIDPLEAYYLEKCLTVTQL